MKEGHVAVWEIMQNAWEIHISLIHPTFSKTTYMTFIRATLKNWPIFTSRTRSVWGTVTRKWNWMVCTDKEDFCHAKLKRGRFCSEKWNQDNWLLKSWHWNADEGKLNGRNLSQEVLQCPVIRTNKFTNGWLGFFFSPLDTSCFWSWSWSWQSTSLVINRLWISPS